ncbi:HprK-related kinase A [Niveibacterium terrae]|uniref:HprK-related kinase A n=1 Tax=Niveibacterium terrae TaxID=3373598 RepID=UPI003A8CEA98
MNPRLDQLSGRALRNKLHGPGLFVQTGPLIFAIRSREAAIAEALPRLYPEQRLADEDFADFHVEVRRVPGLRGWVKPQIEFLIDGSSPFQPLPQAQSFAMLEWGMNWCIAALCHQYLVIHSAVVEKDGFAALLPAPPGSGKSTLTAALVQRGWRLCSDELTLIDPASAKVIALARPVNLKNQSIDVIRAFAPEAVFGTALADTQKGRVCHMKPPPDSVARVDEAASPRWIVFPRWEKDGKAQLQARPRSASFIDLAENAFNYSLLGELGFTTLTKVIDASETLSLSYGRLDEAVALFNGLAEGAR